MLKMTGKRVLVTGGAVRIGAAICRRLAEAGADVAIHYNHSADEAAALAETLRAHYGIRAATVTGALDLTTAAAAVVEHACRELGSLDVLVNNAAIFEKESLESLSQERLQAQLAVNALSPILLTQAFARGYQGAAGEGCVINLLDRRTATPARGELSYQLSKRMLASFTELAALELAPAIRVNAVAPGPVLAPPGMGESYLREKAGPYLTAVRCTPEDIAEAVLFLICAPAITGQILYVDSGQRFLAQEMKHG